MFIAKGGTIAQGGLALQSDCVSNHVLLRARVCTAMGNSCMLQEILVPSGRTTCVVQKGAGRHQGSADVD